MDKDLIINEIDSTILGQNIKNKTQVRDFLLSSFAHLDSKLVSVTPHFVQLLSISAFELDRFYNRLNEKKLFYDKTLPSLLDLKKKDLDTKTEINNESIASFDLIINQERMKEEPSGSTILSATKEIQKLNTLNQRLSFEYENLKLNTIESDNWIDQTGNIKNLPFHNLDSTFSNLVKLFKMCGLTFSASDLKKPNEHIVTDFFGRDDE